MATSQSNSAGRPPFASLPLRPGDPAFSAWGLYGADDQLGTLNLLSPSRVLGAVKGVKSGITIGLNLPLDVPSPPSHGRKGFTHRIIHKAPRNVHDDVIDMNTQCSTQWDGFRHYGYQAQNICYNGTTVDEISGDRKSLKLGIHAWCNRGIAGRGVLLDYASYAEGQGLDHDALSDHAVTLSDLLACAKHQSLEFEEGDILLIRFGWTKAYCSLDATKRLEWSLQRPVRLIGVETSLEMARWLWETGFSAVAADTVAFEKQPFDTNGEPGGLEKIGLHEVLLGGWGTPIGEMWDLELLSQTCCEHKQYSFFLTSMPLNIPGGIAGPANAMAIL